MHTAQLNRITKDIESRLKSGEGYHITVGTHTGHTFTGGWRYLDSNTVHSVVVLSEINKSPVYVPVASIEFVRLAS